MTNNFIGIDIIQKSRMNLDLSRRFLSPRELEIYDKWETEATRLDFLTGRWAAKEAIIKLTNREVLFKDIEILDAKSMAPIVYLYGEESKDIYVSISHEIEYAVAVAIKKS